MDTKADPKLLPLVVDLDGTVIATDSLWELVMLALKRNLLMLFVIPLWVLQGKSTLKQKLASYVEIDPAALPYRQDVLDWLIAEKAGGRKLVLATGAPRRVAETIAAHLGLFDVIMASENGINLTSSRKREALIAAFGDGGFDYAGNSREDIAVFDAASSSIVVAPDAKALAWQARHQARLIEGQSAGLKTWIKMLRVHQWAKNALIAVPAVLSNALLSGDVPLQITLAFFSFSLLASCIYIINDLFDLQSDRVHKTKRQRPLAAGLISIPSGIAVAAALLIASVSISLMLPFEFRVVLALYAVLTSGYTFWFKRMLLIDVLALAGLYTVRVIAGAAATMIEASFWLLAFSVFFFLSLALVKRFVELSSTADTGTSKLKGRGYRSADKQVLGEAGMASTFAAVLVLALYIDSDEVKLIYGTPFMLWLLCPIVLYLSMRIWVLARRDEMHEDPVVFLLTDWRSLVMVAAGAALVVAAAAM